MKEVRVNVYASEPMYVHINTSVSLHLSYVEVLAGNVCDRRGTLWRQTPVTDVANYGGKQLEAVTDAAHYGGKRL